MATNYSPQYAPGQYPPPQRSFAGPIVLIALGVLFLLGNLNKISWPSMGSMFARWWPLLIILWGVVKLIEYGVAQREGRRAAGIGAGGVVLLVFLILTGLTASGVHRFANQVDLGDLRDFDNDNDFFNGMFGEVYHFDQELHQALPAGASLKVASEHGTVTVNPWDQSDLKVMVTKRLRAHDQADADKQDNATKVQISVNGSEVLVNANTTGAGSRGVDSDLVIYLPRRAAVNVAANHGDITISGRDGEVQVSDSHGDTTISDVVGNVHVAMHGSVHASKITGDVRVDGRPDEVNVDDVSGSLMIAGDVMDSMTLARIGKTVTYHSSRTELEMASLPGDLTLESDDLTGKQISGPLRLVTRSKDIHLDDVSGDANVENANGELEFHAGKPLGNLQLTNKNADINLFLPGGASFQVNATVRRGEISSDFGGISTSNSENEGRASGVFGSGGPKVEISNEHGDVQIRKAG